MKISDLSGKYVETTEERITQLGLDNSSAKIFKKGTILYTIFATIGEVAILNIDAATNQAIAGITCKEPYNLDYMYYVLLVLKDLLFNAFVGAYQRKKLLTRKIFVKFLPKPRTDGKKVSFYK